MEKSVQVAIRIRPKILGEITTEDKFLYEKKSITINLSKSPKTKKFHQVFGPKAKQEDLYSFIAPSINLAEQGISSTILAFGPAGSGKTFTIFGIPSDLGMIHKVFSHLFQCLSSSFIVSYSMMQIYNEKIYDMIEDLNLEHPLQLKQDPCIGVKIDKISKHPVNSSEIGMQLTNIGKNNRLVNTQALSMNRSRSHAICEIYLESATANAKGNFIKSTIRLCDLASCDKISYYTSQQEIKYKDMAIIDVSLLKLSSLIQSLASKKQHFVPYKDSILTYVLKDTLEGRVKFSIITTISLSNDQVSETLCALKFASKAKKIITQAVPCEITLAEKQVLDKVQNEFEHMKNCPKKNINVKHKKSKCVYEENSKYKSNTPYVSIKKLTVGLKKLQYKLGKKISDEKKEEKPSQIVNYKTISNLSNECLPKSKCLLDLKLPRMFNN
jgi:kinesin family protein C2/C3